MNILLRIKKAIDRKWYKWKSEWLSRHASDEAYLKCLFRHHMGYDLNLKNPQTYSEKLQWLKLHDVHEEYSQLVDKYEVKEIIRERIGDEYIIPTLGLYNSFDEINFDSLPNQFVLKTTHDSGGVYVCPDKTKLDIMAARKKIEDSLHSNYYEKFREYPYKNVKPRIIAEQYMVDESGTELKDYKFYCFNGICKMILIASDRHIGNVKMDFFNPEFIHLNIKWGHPWSTHEIKKPDNFDKMLEISQVISQDMPHARVDLYNISGKIYFGELTFFPTSGLTPFESREWDYKLGEYLALPSKE